MREELEANGGMTTRERKSLLVLAGLTALFGFVLMGGSASAWQEKTLEPLIGDYQTGDVYSDCSSATPGQAQYSGILSLYRNGCSYYDDFYSYDISTFDHASYVAGARLDISFWPSATACSNVQWSLRPLYLNPLT